MTRVNKVSVSIDDEYDVAKITLYRNNTKITEFTSDDVEIPLLCETEVNRTVYQQYCRDLVINLLQNGGIEGLYYEEKQTVNDGQTKKYGSSAFTVKSRENISTILNEIGVVYDIKLTCPDDIQIIDRYKDGNIKYATIKIKVVINNKTIIIQSEIKSGQMCKPKTFESDGIEHSLNATNIMRYTK